MNLDKLLRPRTVVMVGASEKIGSMNGNISKKILDSRLDKVFFVNPSRETVFGEPCYKSIDELPDVPDCAAICVKSELVQETLEQAGRKGIKGAVVYASGYSETVGDEGKEREEQLIEICRKYDIALCGPNCAGFLNDRDGFWPYGPVITSPDGHREGLGLSLISQSGGVTIDIYDNPYTRVSYAISAGNCSVVKLEDYMDYLLEDEATDILGLYIEGIRYPARFVNALRRAAELRKPVVILKGGRSEKGGAVAGSHTGSLAGSAASFREICRRFGVILVDSLAEFRATVAALNGFKGKYPKNLRLASISRSGANATLSADLADQAGLEMPDFSDETVKKLLEILPDFATVHNPLDASSGLKTVEKFGQTVKAASEDENIDAIVLTVAEFMHHDLLTDRTVEALREIRRIGVTKPVIMIPNLEESRDEEMWRQIYESDGIVVSPGLAGYKILRNLAEFFRFNPSEHTLTAAVFETNQKRLSGDFLTEWESKMLLKESGFPIPAQQLASSKEEADAILQEMDFPVVLKVCSKGIPHKTEAGGVKLNLRDREEALAAYDAIMENCRAYAPEAVIDGVIISGMAPKGVELILGIKTDIQFGPMILAGLGGIYVDIFKDFSLRPCPVGKGEALEMLRSLKAGKLLAGYRGSLPCDVEAAAESIVKLSEFAAAHRDELIEMDINPLVVYEEGRGTAALDALIKVRK